MKCFFLTSTLVLLFSYGVSMAQDLELDGSHELNQHADQVGIWVNTSSGTNDEAMVDALRSLKIKSIRYGWQCGVLDLQNLGSQAHSPNDKNFSGYLSDGEGRIWETFGPNDIADLMTKTAATGFAVLSTDGINYIGKSDAAVAKMSSSDRLNLYANHAANWARWAKGNPFEYFEIGNENDLSGRTHTKDAITPWTPIDYAHVARRFLTDVKRANPNAKCGINGGLHNVEFTERWFREIVEAEPSLAQELDFIVAHKYEMWLDHKTWAMHPDWDFGRVGEDFRKSHRQHFSKLPIHVTELGSWKTNENDSHYRALLATEMLGNVRMDATVQHVQFWPSHWQKEGGVFDGTDSRLTSMGLGLAAYTRFAQSMMFANGFRGNVRYFATKGHSGATFWFVNHAQTETRLNCRVSGLQPMTSNEVWSLESPSQVATASDTVLKLVGTAAADSANGDLIFSLTAAPLSVAIVTFSNTNPAPDDQP